MEFSIVQSAPGQGATVAGGVVWRTCLREIAFVENGATVPDALTTFRDDAAYAHLLEVICGLGSPIIGETEVMHQFKAFVAGLPAEHAALRDLSERLLVDARMVRARHLVGLGSRSYGSAVRRHVRDCPRVALIGTGMLAREILPFLQDDGRALDLWGRHESLEWEAAGVSYRRIDANDGPALGGRSAIVVAAPIGSTDIARLHQRYSDVVRLVDLRGEARNDPPPAIASLVTLDDVYAELKAAGESTDRQAAAARAEIRRCARAFVTRAKLNPSGWHDLCA
jgi:glutamyl-tRNA reductase